MKRELLFTILLGWTTAWPNLCLAEMKAKGTDPLQVQIVSPKEGETVRGKIKVEAIVSNPGAIDFVDFYFQEPGAKDRYSWKDYVPPYLWGGDGQTLDTTLFADGPASAVAFCRRDGSKAPLAEHRVRFTIDNGKPQVTIVAPIDGQEVSGEILIRVEASDPKGMKQEAGIAAVYLYLDGAPVGKLTKAPFEVRKSACLLSPGRHSILAVAEDSEGLNSSQRVTVNVR